MARANPFWPTAVVGETDSVNSVSASACHIGGPIGIFKASCLTQPSIQDDQDYLCLVAFSEGLKIKITVVVDAVRIEAKSDKGVDPNRVAVGGKIRVLIFSLEHLHTNSQSILNFFNE